MDKSKTYNFSRAFSHEGEHMRCSPEGPSHSNLKSTVARGNGCNYGDAGLADIMIHPPSTNIHILKDHLYVRVDAGVTYGRLLARLLEENLFLSVIPGYQDITIGGAIAANIHGKNHPTAGNISSIVTAIKLWTPTWGATWYSLENGSHILKATCGGLGLTGVILEADLKVIRLDSQTLIKHIIKGKKLEELCSKLLSSSSEYNVAWVDMTKASAYPFVLEQADHAQDERSTSPLKKGLLERMISLIPNTGIRFIRKWNISLYNKFYFQNSTPGTNVIAIKDFLFPLDKIKGWENLYGKTGFIQYQFVVRADKFIGLVEKMKVLLKQYKSFVALAVVKRMGSDNSGSSVSFSGPGLTLSMDIPKTKYTKKLHSELTRELLNAEGRIYLIKDGLMDSNQLRKMYPGLKEFEKVRAELDPQTIFSSLQSRRLLEDHE